LVWLAAARLRHTSELACDDAVLRSGVRPTSYADLLLQTANAFVARGITAPVTMAMARPSQIQARIHAVLSTGVPRSPLSRGAVVLSAAILIGILAPMAAMQSEDDTVYRIGGEVVPPKVIEKQEPSYTPEAREARIEGAVVLKIEIDRTGRVRRADIVRGLDPGLDAKAAAAVLTWKFDPARKAGKPVIVSANVEINSKLL
jgi:TonB family protein